MKRLLLIEDDQTLGQTLEERLMEEGYFVQWAENLIDARKAISQHVFHLIILDVGLPDGTGFEFAREIKQFHPCPFIFVTAQNSAESRLEGYEAGAEEFIPKPFHLKELLMRIRHVLDDHNSSSRLELEGITIDFAGMYTEKLDGTKEHLPLRDFQVLRLLVDKSPAVVSRDEIMDKVWGREKFPTNRTIDNVILRLRQSLGERGSKWIKSVRGVGYQWNVKNSEE
ncbi:MAG: response regulator transcription factor [Bdellovibrionales bacterium]|nr:response regulator transcription factor [Bdellovibrionales bacterium]